MAQNIVQFNFYLDRDILPNKKIFQDEIDIFYSLMEGNGLFLSKLADVAAYNALYYQVYDIFDDFGLVVDSILNSSDHALSIDNAGFLVIGGGSLNEIIHDYSKYINNINNSIKREEKPCFAWNWGAEFCSPSSVVQIGGKFPVCANAIDHQVYCQYLDANNAAVRTFLINNPNVRDVYCLKNTSGGTGVRSKGGAKSLVYGVSQPIPVSLGYRLDGANNLVQFI